jgi:hypothetical protein
VSIDDDGLAESFPCGGLQAGLAIYQQIVIRKSFDLLSHRVRVCLGSWKRKTLRRRVNLGERPNLGVHRMTLEEGSKLLPKTMENAFLLCDRGVRHVCMVVKARQLFWIAFDWIKMLGVTLWV